MDADAPDGPGGPGVKRRSSPVGRRRGRPCVAIGGKRCPAIVRSSWARAGVHAPPRPQPPPSVADAVWCAPRSFFRRMTPTFSNLHYREWADASPVPCFSTTDMFTGALPLESVVRLSSIPTSGEKESAATSATAAGDAPAPDFTMLAGSAHGLPCAVRGATAGAGPGSLFPRVSAACGCVRAGTDQAPTYSAG